MPQRNSIGNINGPDLVNSRDVAKWGHVTPRTARKHLREQLGPGIRALGEEKWPAREVWQWLFPTVPYRGPAQNDWQ